MLEDMSDKELEEQLMEAGRKLHKLPSSADDVLKLLEDLESCLSKVEQSPSKSMQDAYLPALKALASSDLLRHEDLDVKVSVASCVSEITRITAPDAPYTDDEMKEIFKVIVEAFEMLGDTSSRSYLKRVSILETVAKVRSCVVMLDLECDGLILEMFHHFLTSVRDHHPDNVFTSMETIMSLVLEESEEIAAELLYPLLDSLKKENQDILPVARKLAEKVLENCRPKLKPYLMETLKSLGKTPSDYSKIVGSICEVTADTTEHNDDSVSGEHLADDRSASEKVVTDELPQVSEETKPEAACPVEVDMVSEKSATIATSNGDAQNLKDESAGVDSPEIKEDDSLPAPEVPQDESDNLETKIDEPESEQPAKRKRGRPIKYTPERSGKTKTAVDKEVVSKDKSIIKPGPENESVAQASSQAPPDKSAKVEKRGRPRKNKETIELADKSPPAPKEAMSSEKTESDAPPSADAPDEEGGVGEKIKRRVGKKTLPDKETEKNSVVTSDSEGKPLKKSGKRTGKKSDTRGTKDQESSPTKKSSAVTSDSEDRPLKKSGKKLDARGKKDEESSPKTQGVRTNKGKAKTSTEKDVPGGSSKKVKNKLQKKASSVKSSEKLTSKDQTPLKETPITKSKRKRGEKEEASEKPSVKDLGKNLIGSKIKVYWPEDDQYYEGTVDSLDPSSKKHKILYDDGEVEHLILKDEVWEPVKAGRDGGKALDFSSPDVSSMPKKKKAKANPGSASKQAKTDDTGKKEKGASASKAKESSTRKGKLDKSAAEDSSQAESDSKAESGGKSKGKSNTKGKDDTKSGTKTKSTPKAASQSKDTTPKSSKSKDSSKATPKSEVETAKSKSKSKKSGSKSGANGTPSKRKAEESEELPKSPEKKRRKD